MGYYSFFNENYSIFIITGWQACLSIYFEPKLPLCSTYYPKNYYCDLCISEKFSVITGVIKIAKSSNDTNKRNNMALKCNHNHASKLIYENLLLMQYRRNLISLIIALRLKTHDAFLCIMLIHMCLI